MTSSTSLAEATALTSICLSQGLPLPSPSFLASISASPDPSSSPNSPAPDAIQPPVAPVEFSAVASISLFQIAFSRLLGLRFFPRLRRLEVMQQGIKLIEGLDSSSNLEALVLTDNCVEKVQGLEALARLRELGLARNALGRQAHDLAGLAVVAGTLVTLDLSFNEVSTLEDCPPLPQLQRLLLGGNRLRSCRDVPRVAPRVLEVNLAGNAIAALDDLQHLKRLAHAQAVHLEHPEYGQNPVCLLEHYRDFAVLHLASLPLVVLDAKPLMRSDVKDAQQRFLEKKLYYRMLARRCQRCGIVARKEAVDRYVYALHSFQVELQTLYRALKSSADELFVAKARGLPRRDLILLRSRHERLEQFVVSTLDEMYSPRPLHRLTARLDRAVTQLVSQIELEQETMGNVRVDYDRSAAWVTPCVDFLSLTFDADAAASVFGVGSVLVLDAVRLFNRERWLRFVDALPVVEVPIDDVRMQPMRSHRFHRAKPTVQSRGEPHMLGTVYLLSVGDVQGVLSKHDAKSDGAHYTPTHLTNRVTESAALEPEPTPEGPSVRSNRGSFRVAIVRAHLGRCVTREMADQLDAAQYDTIIDGIDENALTALTDRTLLSTSLHFHCRSDLVLPAFVLTLAFKAGVDPEATSPVALVRLSEPLLHKVGGFVPVASTLEQGLSHFLKRFDKLRRRQQAVLAETEAMMADSVVAERLRTSLAFTNTRNVGVVAAPDDLLSLVGGSQSDGVISEISEPLLSSYAQYVFNQSSFEQLTYLNLHSNRISSLAGLSRLVNLHVLILSMNEIVHVRGLEDLVSLQRLSLDHNQIESLAGLATLSSLEQLDVSYNSLSNLDDVRMLGTHLPLLRTLSTRGNPFCAYTGYTALADDLDSVTWDVRFSSDALRQQLVDGTTALDDPSGSAVLDDDMLYSRATLTKRPVADSVKMSEQWRFQTVGLDLAGLQCEVLPNLERFPVLVRLNLRQNKLHTLTHIDRARRLEELHVCDNRLRVLPADDLSRLHHLRSLSLDRNQIDDLTPLASLTALEELSAEGNKISDLEPLGGLYSLREVYLGDNSIFEPDQLRTLDKLTSLLVLVLSGNPLCEWAEYRHFCIYHLPQLAVLDLHSVEPYELHRAREFYTGRLTEEDLRQVVGPQSVLGHVQVLDLSSRGIRAANVVNGATLHALRHLCLDDNEISDSTALAPLPMLKVLKLNHNRLSEFRLLDKMGEPSSGQLRVYFPRLEVLELGDNQFRSIGALRLSTDDGKRPFKSLRVLSLEHNEISALPAHCLGNVPNLEQLVLLGNRIRSWHADALAGLHGLCGLQLDYNQLKRLTPVATLPNLRVLSMAHNRLSDLGCITTLAPSLPRLKELSMHSNPASRRNNVYRPLAVGCLTSLSALDGIPITLVERQRAAAIAEANTLSNVTNLAAVIATPAVSAPAAQAPPQNTTPVTVEDLASVSGSSGRSAITSSAAVVVKVQSFDLNDIGLTDSPRAPRSLLRPQRAVPARDPSPQPIRPHHGAPSRAEVTVVGTRSTPPCDPRELEVNGVGNESVTSVASSRSARSVHETVNEVIAAAERSRQRQGRAASRSRSRPGSRQREPQPPLHRPTAASLHQRSLGARLAYRVRSRYGSNSSGAAGMTRRSEIVPRSVPRAAARGERRRTPAPPSWLKFFP